MLHAFTGIAKYSVASHVPIIPVGIRGAFEIFSRHVSRPKFEKILDFYVGKPLYFHEHYGKELSEEELRHLTDKVMAEISQLSGKKYLHYGKLQRKYHE